ncbi:hypothetical protein [uncultured Nostoc sp.]|uniref:hypothetical protein n=1 Tax=uncultured Nostoc sp. TaxID=340711 RepID=UPI0035CBBE7E
MISSPQSQYVLVNSSQYWSWYANQERWNANSQTSQALSGFADQVYEKLKEFLGIDPIKSTPLLLCQPPQAQFWVGELLLTTIPWNQVDFN